MSQTQTLEHAADPFRIDFGPVPEEQPKYVVPTGRPVGMGAAQDIAAARIITAQNVAVKRNRARILKEACELAVHLGQRTYYHWTVNSRATGKKEIVEGPTIDCAMAAISVYGNCSIEAFPAQETATHWTFAARFVDYETGLTFVRSFQQRKSQSAGKMDADRQSDIVFQIGQSKAIRNVICGSLPWLVDAMIEEAKHGLLAKVQANPGGYKNRIAVFLDNANIPVVNIERQIGRAFAEWRIQDIATISTQIVQVRDGFATASDLWPAPKDDDMIVNPEAEQPKQEKPPTQRSAAQPKAKEQAEPPPQDELPPHAGNDNDLGGE